MAPVYGLGTMTTFQTLSSIPPAPRVVTCTEDKLRVYKLDGDDEHCDWNWSVWHYEDSAWGGRSHVTVAWGRCTRWEDALAGGLCALKRIAQ